MASMLHVIIESNPISVLSWARQMWVAKLKILKVLAIPWDQTHLKDLLGRLVEQHITTCSQLIDSLCCGSALNLAILQSFSKGSKTWGTHTDLGCCWNHIDYWWAILHHIFLKSVTSNNVQKQKGPFSSSFACPFTWCNPFCCVSLTIHWNWSFFQSVWTEGV